MSLRRIQPAVLLARILAAHQTWKRTGTNSRIEQIGEVKIFSLTLLVWLGFLVSGFADLPVDWEKNPELAISQSATNQKPVLLYFTATWCGPCKLMARTTLTNELVQQTLSQFTRVAVDIDEHQELAGNRSVQAVPTFQVLTPNGELAATTTGYQDAETFVQWLTNALDNSAQMLARQTRSAEKLKAALGWLKSGDAETERKGIAELTDLCVNGSETVQKNALSRLAILAESKPVLLLEGLNHPRLAVRIRIANLLREKLGADFNVDPWSDAAVRNDAIARCREKLSGPTSGKSP